jgi:outer membrane protein TolC
MDLPLDRTAERNAYRTSLLNLDGAARDLQQSEDQIKADVRADLADLLLASEQIRIQAKSVAVAQKRVDSTNLFLDAGRAQIRDVLDAQDSLVQAQNDLTTALMNYRLAELSLQRDMGVLEVNSDGLWREYAPSGLREQQ